MVAKFRVQRKSMRITRTHKMFGVSCLTCVGQISSLTVNSWHGYETAVPKTWATLRMNGRESASDATEYAAKSGHRAKDGPVELPRQPPRQTCIVRQIIRAGASRDSLKFALESTLHQVFLTRCSCNASITLGSTRWAKENSLLGDQKTPPKSKTESTHRGIL